VDEWEGAASDVDTLGEFGATWPKNLHGFSPRLVGLNIDVARSLTVLEANSTKVCSNADSTEVCSEADSIDSRHTHVSHFGLLAWRHADFRLLVHWNADRIIYEFGITG
jgi:hypothetical protein